MKKLLKCSSLVAMALALAACGGGENSDDPKPDPKPDPEPTVKEYDAKIWVSEVDGVKEATLAQIAKWNETNGSYKINATIEGVTEADAASQVLTDVESAPDIYCFAQDQMNRLVIGGALNKLGTKAAQFVKDNNTAGSVKAVSVAGDVYAYPITADNGYFMMYDKRVVKEEHLNSLEDIVADCEAAGKNFSMENETSAWYIASWFFGAGCKSEWTTNSTGGFTSVDDTFDSEAGLIAMRGMQHLVKSKYYVSESGAAQFSAAIPAGVLVSGTWAVTDAKAVLGDNLGFAKLPCYTVDGKQYQMGSYSGYKLMGVKPQTDNYKSAALNSLAQYLSGEECQLERFTKFGWGPSNLTAQANEEVKSNEALAALQAQDPYATSQGQIHGSWWDIAKVLGKNAKAADYDDKVALQAGLDTYKTAIDALFSMSDEEKRAFTVIGSLKNTGWLTDFEMVEDPANIWTSVDSFTITDEDIANGYNKFKCRQGKSWDVSYGNGSEDYIIDKAGTYKIKLTVTDTGGTIELINC